MPDAETIEVLHNMSWFDGIVYILLGMVIYFFYKWVNHKFK